MFLFLIFKKPFTEIVLNYANIVTELGLCLIFPMVSLYLYDISNNSREKIDIFLVVLVNFIISSQMLASLHITAKVLIQKIRNKKSSQTSPEITKEQNKQMKVLIIPSESEKNDDFSNKKLRVSPRYSCEVSMINDESEAYSTKKNLFKAEENKKK